MEMRVLVRRARRGRARARGSAGGRACTSCPTRARDERHACAPARGRAQRPLVEALRPAASGRSPRRRRSVRSTAGRTPDVIAVRVRDHERGERVQPHPPELAVDTRLGRPGIDEHRALPASRAGSRRPGRRRGTTPATLPAATTTAVGEAPTSRPRGTGARADRGDDGRAADGSGGSARRARRCRRATTASAEDEPCATTSARTGSDAIEAGRERDPRRCEPLRSMRARPRPAGSPARARPLRDRSRAAPASPARRARSPARSRAGSVPNWSQRIGAVDEPAGRRDPDHLDEPASARDSPRCHRRRRGIVRKIAATAANESWKPGSSSDRGVQASSTTAPIAIVCQRSLGRESSHASEARQPATAARTTDGCHPTASA